MADNISNFEIPKTCKAGCVIDEGPNFRVEVQDVPVPEPGRTLRHDMSSTHCFIRLRRNPYSAECNRNLLF